MSGIIELDLYTDIVKFEVTLGRPFIQVTKSLPVFGDAGIDVSPGGTYVFGQVEFAILAFPGSVDVSSHVSTPPEDGSSIALADVLLWVYLDVTPGALEAALAASGGTVPPGAFGYQPPASNFSLVASNQNPPEQLYSGPLWVLNAVGGITEQANFDDPSSPVMDSFDPPISWL